MKVDSMEVLEELREINPLMVELATERVARRRLERENRELVDALGAVTRDKIVAENELARGRQHESEHEQVET